MVSETEEIGASRYILLLQGGDTGYGDKEKNELDQFTKWS